MTAQEIRALREDEGDMLEALHRNAYRVDAATARRWRENTKFETTRAIVGEGRVLSAIKILPFTMLVGGRQMPMGGIGGVATWADQQGSGLARTLMRYSVEEMRRLGHVVSALFPFSHAYYARFGWSTSSRTLIYSFSQSDLRAPKQHTAEIRAAVTPVDMQIISDFYDEYSPRYNGMVLRTPESWARSTTFAPLATQYYLVEDDHRPVGYFACTDEGPSSGVDSMVTVRDCLFKAPAGYEALARFLRNLPTNVRQVRVIAPEVPSLFPYFGECARIELRNDFQFRVIEVERACAMRGWNRDLQCGITIEVQDPLGAWNGGCWHLEINEGSARVKRLTTPAQVRLTINQFSELFIGGANPREWLIREEVPGLTRATADRLQQIFCDRPVHLMEWF